MSISINTALLGGYLWALLVALKGSRRSLIAVLIFTLLLPVGIGVGTLISFCPSPCPTAWPLGEIVNWTNLIAGLAAVASVGLYLRTAYRPPGV